MIEVDRDARRVTLRLPDWYWWPTIGETTGAVLKLVAYAGVVWIIYAAGQASMASIALDARGDADWCMSLVEPVLGMSERALGLTRETRAVQDYWLLSHPQPATDMVAEAIP